MKAFRTLIVAAILVGGCGRAWGDACKSLQAISLPHVVILEAREVSASRPEQRSLSGVGSSSVGPSTYCSVRAVATPVRGSRIGFEVWLPPATDWMGRLRMFGNGGYGSELPRSAMSAGLRSGAVSVATDTGHTGDDPEFAVGRLQAIDDWGWRAVHETALAAKVLTAAYYGRGPDWSYFEGCSTGGHQALMEAQRFPRDFDGVLAGAPGNNRTRLNIGFLWQFVANHRVEPPHQIILPSNKLHLLTELALATCGTDADRSRGFLADPFACHPDPQALACNAEETNVCLTSDQIVATNRMYAGATNPRTGAEIYPPWLPGSESVGAKGAPLPGWSQYWEDSRSPGRSVREAFFKFWVFRSARWDWRTFDFDGDVGRAMKAVSNRIDAVSTDLDPFRRAGGKLILYHGLADPVVSPWDTRHYYEAVASVQGERIDSFVRMFFVPGMAHCGGGPVPDAQDLAATLQTWVEQGIAPDQVRAVRAAAFDQDAVTLEVLPFPHLQRPRVSDPASISILQGEP